MSVREKILVGMMAVAVIGGGVRGIGTLRCASTETEWPGQVEARMAAFIGRGRDTLRAAEPDGVALTAELQQQAPWAINPFAHGKGPVHVVVAPPERVVVTYSGFLVLGGSQRAMLNGRAYGVGDEIPGTGLRVQAIRPDTVVLEPVDKTESGTIEVEKTRTERGQK